MADSIATAYVQIEPTFEGVSGKLKKELGDMSDDAGKSAGASFGQGFGSVIGGSAKVIAGAVAAGGAALAGLGASFVKSSGDVAAYGDNIDKMSQKMGLTAQAYQEWDAVMQHSGTSMETMKASMKTLANAAQSGNKAFEELGITQEQLANMSQQEIFEATIAGLQNVEDTTQRTYLAGKLLGRGATELGALLNTSAEDTQAMRDRVRELGGVMSDDAVKAAAAYQDQLQDMQTAFSGLSRNMMSSFLPSITTVMSGLTEIFSGNTEGGLSQISEGIKGIADGITQSLPQIMQVGAAILSALGEAIVQNLPTLMSAGVDVLNELSQGILTALPELIPTVLNLVTGLANMIIENLPLLLEAAVQVIVSLATGIAQALPELIPTIVEVVTNMCIYLIENVDLLIDAALQLMVGLAEGMINALPILIEKAPIIISKLVVAFLNAIPKLLETGAKVITVIIDGITKTVPQLLREAPKLIENLKKEFLLAIPKIVEVGKNIVEGIKKGISDAWDSFTNWVGEKMSSLVEGIKKFFEIGSPSELLADEIGYWLPPGIAVGIDKGMNILDDAVNSMMNEVVSQAMNPTIMSQYTPEAEGNDISLLLEVLRTWLPAIANKDTNVVLEGDAGRLFRLIQRESIRNTELVGTDAVLSAI